MAESHLTLSERVHRAISGKIVVPEYLTQAGNRRAQTLARSCRAGDCGPLLKLEKHAAA